MSLIIFNRVFRSAAVIFPGAHAATQRWIYSVPLGQRAEVRYMHTYVQDAVPLGIGAAGAYIRLTVLGVPDNTIPTETRGIAGVYQESVGCEFDLSGNDSIEGYTFQTGAGNVIYRVQAIIREYR